MADNCIFYQSKYGDYYCNAGEKYMKDEWVKKYCWRYYKECPIYKKYVKD
ncbi:MAG TPA: hypothetical protein GXZ29_04670 [Clostridiales bacterium]|jgi:hypothetical protein|nr:hypothetical protein [Clostridiales bacterium]